MIPRCKFHRLLGFNKPKWIQRQRITANTWHMERKGRKHRPTIYTSQSAQASANWTFTSQCSRTHYDSAQVKVQNLLVRFFQDEQMLEHVYLVCCFLRQRTELCFGLKFAAGQGSTATSSSCRLLCFCRPTRKSCRFRWTISYTSYCLSKCHSTNRRYI